MSHSPHGTDSMNDRIQSEAADNQHAQPTSADAQRKTDKKGPHPLKFNLQTLAAILDRIEAKIDAKDSQSG